MTESNYTSLITKKLSMPLHAQYQQGTCDNLHSLFPPQTSDQIQKQNRPITSFGQMSNVKNPFGAVDFPLSCRSMPCELSLSTSSSHVDPVAPFVRSSTNAIDRSASHRRSNCAEDQYTYWDDHSHDASAVLTDGTLPRAMEQSMSVVESSLLCTSCPLSNPIGLGLETRDIFHQESSGSLLRYKHEPWSRRSHYKFNGTPRGALQPYSYR